MTAGGWASRRTGSGRGFFHEHIEVSEDGSLAPLLASALRRALLAMDAKKRVGEAMRRALGVLKAFSPRPLRIPNGPELSIDVEAVAGPADSSDLAPISPGLFVELGEVARSHETGVFLTLDELHYADAVIMTALIVGLHRGSRLGLPISIAGVAPTRRGRHIHETRNRGSLSGLIQGCERNPRPDAHGRTRTLIRKNQHITRSLSANTAGLPPARSDRSTTPEG